MPDLSLPSAGRLRALDGLASDTRSLLRRAGRVQRLAADLGDPALDDQSRELVDATERLLSCFEERRREARLAARQRVLDPGPETDEP
ncbi:MAG TPA: hypothetical protein VI138_01190 [Candidatus Dormibacteraeota bacterium]